MMTGNAQITSRIARGGTGRAPEIGPGDVVLQPLVAGGHI